jgi:hypothetical protein
MVPIPLRLPGNPYFTSLVFIYLNLKDWFVIMAGTGLSAGLDYLTGLLLPPDQEKTDLKPELPGPLPATGKLN